MKRFNASCCRTILGIILFACQFLLVAAAAAEPARPSAGDVTGQLLDAAGKPVSGVTVCLCARRLDVYEAQFPQDGLSKQQLRDWKDGEGEWYFRDTGADGRFSFPRPRNPFIFLVSTDQGYVLARPTGPAQPVTLRLTPWARLEGVVTARDEPAGGGISIDGQYDDPRFQNDGPYLHFSARTDEQGRFVFPRAIEGEYVVRRRMKDAYGTSLRVKVPAGKATTVTLPILGRPVSGRLALPESLRGRQDLYIETTRFQPLLELPAVTLPKNVLGMTPAERLAWFEGWGRTPEGKRALARYDARHERVRASFKPDGSFTAVDVPPGTYSLDGLFFARKEGRIDYEKRLAVASYEVTVPEGDFDAPADVGALEPRVYGTVGVGQVAPDVVFGTLDGRDRRLSEFRGKVILLDFWGTWCGPCVAELPNLKAIHQAFGRRPDFAMVSLSVDDEPPKVERFVRENGMAWTHGVLGERSTAWSLRLYQVSGFPTFYLIGRDGKVVAHGHWAADLKPLVEDALGAGDADPRPCVGACDEEQPDAAAAKVGAAGADVNELAAQIRRSDGRIKTLAVEFDVEVQPAAEPTQYPMVWKSKGEKRLLTEIWPTRNYTRAYDGRATRHLNHYKDPKRTHEGTVRDGLGRFGTKIVHPQGLTARRVWEADLLEAMGAGRVTVRKETEEVDGAKCNVLEGTMLAGADGFDPAKPDFRLWLDPRHGYMPRRLEEVIYRPGTDRLIVRNVADEYLLAETLPGVWYPMSVRVRSMRQEDGTWKTTAINRVWVRSIRVNDDIPDEEFALPFPEGTRVSE